MEISDTGPDVVVVPTGHDGGHEARLRELEHSAERARVVDVVRSHEETAHAGLDARLSALEARVTDLTARVETAVFHPVEAPAELAPAAEDVVEAPAEVIEPPAADETRREPRRKRKHRRL